MGLVAKPRRVMLSSQPLSAPHYSLQLSSRSLIYWTCYAARRPDLREITKEIEGRAPPHLTWVNGLVYYKRRVFVGSRFSARTPILTKYHNSQSAGHPRFEQTLRRVSA